MEKILEINSSPPLPPVSMFKNVSVTILNTDTGIHNRYRKYNTVNNCLLPFILTRIVALTLILTLTQIRII